MTEHRPGTFCWADLATTDAEAAKKFYFDVFGWAFMDMPMGDSASYTMFQKDDKHVCGMFQLTDEMGTHPFWRSYVSVESTDDSAQKVKELGGTVLEGPFDVFDAGRMAFVSDPTGAILGIWQPKQHRGAGLMGEVNTLGWNELMTKDTDAASIFYAGLLGWTAKKGSAAPDSEYIEFQKDGESVGGMLEIKEEWGYVPPNWLIYIIVEDCDGTLKKAEGLGATRVMPPMDIKGVGRLVYIKDPQGAYLAIIQMKP